MPDADQAAVNAEELRRALANWKHAEDNWTNRTIEAAARSWLALLEGDEAMVAKVAGVIYQQVEIRGYTYDCVARAVIAAITESGP